MSIQSLEREIRAAAQVYFCNPKLRNKDIMEWSSATIAQQNGEVVAHLESLGVWVAILTENDKRPAAPAPDGGGDR